MGNTIQPNQGIDAARIAAELAARQAEEAARREALKRATEQAAPPKGSGKPQGPQDGFTADATRTPVALDGASGTAPATNLLTENIRDGQRNCLDAAGDYLAMLPPSQQGRAELLLLDDGRAGTAGHALIRQGDSLYDPLSGQRYDSLEAFNASTGSDYRLAATVNGRDALKILSAPPGSPERQAAIDRAKIPDSAAKLLVAQDTSGTPTPTPIPTVTPTETATPPETYTVVADDNVTVIAAKLGVSVQALREANPDVGGLHGVRGEYIHPGDILIVPPPPPPPLDAAPEGSADLTASEGMVDAADTNLATYGEGETEETRYNGRCLEFVAATTSQANGVVDPILSQGNADAALYEAQRQGRLYSDFSQMPAGAIVFWDATGANGDQGHVAIFTGRFAENGDPIMVTTTGFGEDADGNPIVSGVQEMTLSELNGYETVSASGWMMPHGAETETPTATATPTETPTATPTETLTAEG
ncbi:CHAP and LysM peptidoglycan-binding domain-containing protein [Pyxidicoccus trucidator]|uniref:CHAP and LysM peptidoglycan-binding domain-containing protein n=1 Tax=Pyxidicoccus trucidator TaxID=2709662 RepID=UPI0019674B0A|nr:LysM peptidoglycan-binding domain-containing protein [Pyxidicoccus trucidator]